MLFFWIEFVNRKPGMMAAQSEGDKSAEDVARTKAEALGEVAAVYPLPYPAEPRLESERHGWPSFCTYPNKCKGHTSCQARQSCVD